MALYQDWKKQYEQKSDASTDQYFAAYLEKETEAYKIILSEKMEALQGTVSELATTFGLSDLEMAGFLDGINDSLVVPQEDDALEALEADTQLDLKIDFEKLYINMLAVPAEWLYNLPEWDNIIEKERRDEMGRDYRRSKIAVSHKIGRNEPCPCGSGKKYKNCCEE